MSTKFRIQKKGLGEENSQSRRINKGIHSIIPPVAKQNGGMGYKQFRTQRMLGQITLLESEITSLKRRYFESKEKMKHLKEEMRKQTTKSRTLAVTCALKLYNKEKEYDKLCRQRQIDLNNLSQEILFLESNMLKEKQRLEKIIKNQDEVIYQQKRELQQLLEADRNSLTDPDESDSDSDLSTSPGSGFSVPKFKIRPLNRDLTVTLPPPLPPPIQVTNRLNRRRHVPFRGHSPNRSFSIEVTEKDLTKKINELEVEDDCRSGVTADEGFSSSGSSIYEEIRPVKTFETFLKENGLNSKNIISPVATNHRDVTKPKDVKRQNALNHSLGVLTRVTNFDIIEEHHVFKDKNGQVRKRTYWIGPDL